MSDDEKSALAKPPPAPWGSITRSMATALFGSVIIVYFLQNFVQDHILAGLLPIIVAFNAAVGGFTLARARRSELAAESEQDTTIRVTTAVIGGLSALLSLGVLSLLGVDALEREFFSMVLLIVACCGGVICGLIGSWIAIKQTELSRAKA